MNTNTPGTALDRGLNDLRIRQDALEERNADLESRVAALEGVSSPVDPPHDARESQADFAALSVAVEKAAQDNLPVHIKGRATWRDGVLEVPKGCTGLFSTVGAEIVDRSTERGKKSQFDRPMILWEARQAKIHGFTVIGAREVKKDARAFFFYAPNRCDLHAHKMDIADFTGGAFQLRGQDSPALVDDCDFSWLSNVEGGKVRMGYALAVYGRGSETWRKKPGEVPLSIIQNSRLKEVRHTIALNNGAFARMAFCKVVNKEGHNAAHVDNHGRGIGRRKPWARPGRYLEAQGNEIECEWFWAGIRGGTNVLWDNKVKAEKDNRIGVTNELDPDKDHWPRVYAWDNTVNEFETYNRAPAELIQNYMHKGQPEGWPYYAA